MRKLIQTMPGWNHSLVDSRCLEHDGCIVDLGCLDWDWSKFFIGKKRIIGADPYEKQIDGVEFFNGVVYNYDGKIYLTNKGVASSIYDEGSDEFDVITWKNFCKTFNIDKISVLKLNIEGAEYELLKSMDSTDFEKIDQIAVSFHDWLNPSWSEQTKECMELLNKHNFSIQPISLQWGWYLAIKD